MFIFYFNFRQISLPVEVFSRISEMPITFKIFLSKHKKRKARSEDLHLHRAPSGRGSLPGFGLPKIPPITVMRGQWDCLSSSGEVDFPTVESQSPSRFLLESPTLKTPPGLRGTNRFFVTIEKSNSLVDEPRTCAWPYDSAVGGLRPRGRDHRVKIRKESVAVPKYSMDPHDEFRRSMEEMVRSRLEQNLTVDWDYLVELVMCYVEMNEKEARKYILKAFVDLIVPLRQFQGDIPAPAKSLKNVPRSVRTARGEPPI